MDSTETIKLFDNNNKLIDNYDKTIEMVLKDIHGEEYFDIDEDYTQKIKIEETVLKKEINKKKKNNSIFKEILPVLFFILIFAILVIGGYFFLNNLDLTGVLNG